VKTLDAARNLARKHAGRTPVSILCGDGVYYLDRTLELTGQDSGSNTAPVIFKAKNEGKALLSGGVAID
jgi:hypothetical protein